MSIEAGRRQAGLSLIELIIAMVVVSVGVLGLLGTYRLATMNSTDPLLRKQALSLAEALLDEVLRAPHPACDKDDPRYDAVFRDPEDPAFPADPSQCSPGTDPLGPETQGGIADACPFDNVDDYNGYAVAGGGATCLETAVPAGYRVAVAVSRASLGDAAFGLVDGTAAGSASDGDALRIEVTATAPDGQAVSLAGYRTRYAPKALP